MIILALLLLAVGGVGLRLLHDISKDFTEQSLRAREVIAAGLSVRGALSSINGEYAPPLAGPYTGTPKRTTFDLKRSEMVRHIAELNTKAIQSDSLNEAVENLAKELGAYFATYESYFSDHPVDQEMRRETFRKLSLHSQKIVALTNAIITAVEEKRANGVIALNSEMRRNLVVLGSLMLFGLIAVFICYHYLARRLVDPIARLDHSIEAFRNSNFELSLPTEGTHELASAITSINEMATELTAYRRENDESARRIHQLNRAMLMGLPAPVYLLDAARAMIQINPAAERFNDQLGIDRRLPNKLQRLFELAVERGDKLMPNDVREAVLFRIDEQEYYYLPRIFPLNLDNHEPAGWAVVIQDVTRIRFLDDIKTNLLSTVSHEIKTPLTGIRMALHMMVDEKTCNLTHAQHTMLATATDDCERLLVTLNKLLELARVESGATHLDLKPLDLAALARRSAASFQSSASHQQVEIRLDLEGDHPLIAGDALRLGEVINNLVSNALKHSPKGGVVSLKLTRPDDRYLRLTVTDEGPGVPEMYQQRIFERFFRVPGQQVDGMGLGLFVCREIIRAHEGRIGLQDRQADQTEFFTDLPLA